jgi:non-specific serine/threonine protein kinase
MLASLERADLVEPSILAALGIPQVARESPSETLSRTFAGRQTLILLDNLEHLLQATPALARLLDVCRDLTLLVTSRFPLHLSAEAEFVLPPLVLDEAVELFEERVQTINPEFEAEPERVVIEMICRKLDCLPLAIELAAARVRVLSPSELLRKLDHSLELLTSGPRDVPARQQTLQATIDWSYQLLSPEEQRLLDSLSIFVGGCTLEAAQCVCGATLDQLASLVDKSLLISDQSRGTSRFVLLETIREYAAHRLARSPNEQLLQRRHAEFHATACSMFVEEGRLVPGASEDELGNFRAALVWAEEPEPEWFLQLAMAIDLWIPWHVPEIERCLKRALARPHAPTARLAWAYGMGGWLRFIQDDLSGAQALAEEALVTAKAADAEAVAGGALSLLAQIALDSNGDLQSACSLSEQALILVRKGGGGTGVLRGVLLFRSRVLLAHGDLLAAETIAGELLALAQELEDHDASLHARSVIGRVRRRQGRIPEAARLNQESLTLVCDNHDRYLTWNAIAYAAIDHAEMDPRWTTIILAAVISDRTREGVGPGSCYCERRAIETARDLLGEEPWRNAWAEGSRLSVEQAFHLADKMVTEELKTPVTFGSRKLLSQPAAVGTYPPQASDA